MISAARETFTELFCDCRGIQYYRCRGAVKLFRFLLRPYSLIRTCKNVQNCIFQPKLLDFWTLPIVRYSNTVFLNRHATTQYQNLTSVIPGPCLIE